MRNLLKCSSLLALAVGCSKPADKPATPPADQAAASGPRAIVTVIYNTPKDQAAF